jgi:arylformamidase
MSSPVDIRGTRIVDLSQVYEPGIPCPPGQLPPELQVLSRTAAGGLTNSEAFSLGLHTGTHVDAPFHFFADLGAMETVDAPDRLIGRGVVVDLSHLQGWRPIEAATILAWEERAGVRIAAGDIVLLRTDHWRRWETGPSGKAYMTAGWPYLTADAAAELVERGIKAVGVECMDPDHTDMQDLAAAQWPAHRAFLGAGILIIENLCHLDEIGAPTCTVIGLPLRIRGASSAPLRVIAIV